MPRGRYTINPSGGRYKGFWDVVDVLELFQEWGNNTFLSLKLLTFKVVVLLLLVTAQRGQAILNLSIQGIIVELKEVTFFMLKMLKHNRPGEALDVITVKSFELDYDVCVVCAIQEYLRHTKKLRVSDPVKRKKHRFILSYYPPHKPVSRDTISNYRLGVLDFAGVNVNKYGRRKYGAHSTRGASTSKAKG